MHRRRGRRASAGLLRDLDERGRWASRSPQRSTNMPRWCSISCRARSGCRSRGARGRPGSAARRSSAARLAEPEAEVGVLVVGGPVALVEAAEREEEAPGRACRRPSRSRPRGGSGPRSRRDRRRGRRVRVADESTTEPASCTVPSGLRYIGTARRRRARERSEQRRQPARLDERVAVQQAEVSAARVARRPGSRRGRSRGSSLRTIGRAVDALLDRASVSSGEALSTTISSKTAVGVGARARRDRAAGKLPAAVQHHHDRDERLLDLRERDLAHGVELLSARSPRVLARCRRQEREPKTPASTAATPSAKAAARRRVAAAGLSCARRRSSSSLAPVRAAGGALELGRAALGLRRRAGGSRSSSGLVSSSSVRQALSCAGSSRTGTARTTTGTSSPRGRRRPGACLLGYAWRDGDLGASSRSAAVATG